MAEIDPGDVSSSGDVTVTDRRRAGRVDYKNAHLVDLLRRPGGSGRPNEAADDPVGSAADPDPDVDALAPARGVLLGSLIGAVAWIAIGLAIWLIF